VTKFTVCNLAAKIVSVAVPALFISPVRPDAFRKGGDEIVFQRFVCVYLTGIVADLLRASLQTLDDLMRAAGVDVLILPATSS